MRCTPEGAHLLLQVRTRTLNRELATTFRAWYPASLWTTTPPLPRSYQQLHSPKLKRWRGQRDVSKDLMTAGHCQRGGGREPARADHGRRLPIHVARIVGEHVRVNQE